MSIKSIAAVLAVSLLAFAISGADAAGRKFQIVNKCSQPECTNICTKAYGSHLIKAVCIPSPIGGRQICTCYHNGGDPPSAQPSLD